MIVLYENDVKLTVYNLCDIIW